MISKSRLLAEFEHLVSINSESFHESEMKQYLSHRLQELGLTVHEDSAAHQLSSFGATAGNLYAYLKGTLPGTPLLFSAHMDTVHPGNGKHAVRHPDGTITSDGTTVLGSDDAAGLAGILEALSVIREDSLPHADIEILFPVAEEVYGKGSACFDFPSLRSREAYVLDLTGPIGTAALAAPTLLSIDILVTGKAAHAGFAPEQGINALTAASAALAKIPVGKVSKDTTVNFGLIAGGTGLNIVPEQIRIQGEIRSLRHREAERQAKAISDLFRKEAARIGASAECTVTEQIHAYRIRKDDPVVKRFRRALRDLQSESPNLVSTFGGSDNNHFVQHGIHGIVLSCGMNNVHTTEEYTTEEQLLQCAALTLRLMTSGKDQ